MIITAHSGAQGTESNSKEFLEAIRSGKIQADCFEVDVRYYKKKLFLHHNFTFHPERFVPLEEALFVAKERNIKINLDLKQRHILEKVQDLAVSLGMDEQIIYTGSTLPSDIPLLKAGVIYANIDKFFKGLSPTKEDAKELKRQIDSFNNPRLAGLNICYRLAEPGFYEEAKKLGLRLSMWTVDDGIAMSKLLKEDLDNITTHHPDWAYKIMEESK